MSDTNSTQMEDDLLTVLNSNTIVPENGEDVWNTFKAFGRDDRDFTSLSRWNLNKLLAEAWMKGFDHGLHD